MIQWFKNAVKALFRSVGIELIRWRPGYEKALFPLVGEEMSPLPLAIRGMLADGGDFFFVQIGANDGVRYDALRPLILRYHLRGLLVEPLSDMFEQLKKNYACEPQLAFENAAVAHESGEVSLFRYRSDAPVPDWVHGMATFDEKRLRGMARGSGMSSAVLEERVAAVTIEQLFARHGVGDISLLQVDTEGFDLEVIKMVLDTGSRPALINYEFSNLSLEDRLESCRLLADSGYEFLHGRWDTLAVLTTAYEAGHSHSG